MHSAAPIILIALMFLAAATSCRAADTSPASQPAGLDSTITISNDNACIAEITLSNHTDHALSIGHYLSYELLRTDVTPPAKIASSPANAMSPMFRLLMQPGDSRKSQMTLSEKSLPPGHYQFTITYPNTIFPQPLRKEFDIPLSASTQP